MRELRGDQPVAFEEIKAFLSSDKGFHLLQGAAGCGKTFTLGEVVTYCMMIHLSVIVTSPTHKALRVLKKMIDQPTIPFSTIHSALGMKEYIDAHGVLSFKNDPKAKHLADEYKVIIVDECSMLDDVIFGELVNLVDRGKKVLLVGDSYQIPPVNYEHAKPFLKSIQAEYKISISTLNEIIRQVKDSPIITFATAIRNNIRADVHQVTQIFNSQALKNEFGAVFTVPRAKKAIFITDILPLFQSVEYEKDIDFVKVIGWRNITVDTYNRLIRAHIFGDNLPKIITGDKLILDSPVMEDNKVMISTNEECEVLSTEIMEEELSEAYKLKYYNTRVRVFNNDIFNEYMIRIIHEDSEKTYDKILQMQKALAKSYPIGSFQARSSWIDYFAFINSWAHVKYSYCITAHRAQGSTYHSVYVLAWDILMNNKVLEHNRILYTASTRPSTNLYVEF